MADLIPHVGLVGTLSGGGTLNGIISVPQGASVIPYDGVTEVIPRADAEIILPTMRRFVSEDIIVREIPYSEVSNLSGGTTVSIG